MYVALFKILAITLFVVNTVNSQRYFDDDDDRSAVVASATELLRNYIRHRPSHNLLTDSAESGIRSAVGASRLNDAEADESSGAASSASTGKLRLINGRVYYIDSSARAGLPASGYVAPWLSLGKRMFGGSSAEISEQLAKRKRYNGKNMFGSGLQGVWGVPGKR